MIDHLIDRQHNSIPKRQARPAVFCCARSRPCPPPSGTTEHQLGNDQRHHPSASANGNLLSLLRPEFLFHGRDRSRISAPSSCSVLGRISRRDAEAQRGLLFVSFSPRLRVSAGVFPSQGGTSLGTTEHQLGNANRTTKPVSSRQRLAQPHPGPPSTSSVTVIHRPSVRQEPHPPEGELSVP